MAIFRIDDFARAFRLDDLGLQDLLSEFHEPEGECAVHQKAQKHVSMVRLTMTLIPSPA